MSASGYVAFEPTEAYGDLFSEKTFSFIAKEVMDITKNSHLGVEYLVPNPRIKEVMDSIWSNFRPNTGDIATRYAINNETPYRYINYSADIIRQVITVIVNDIMNYVDITKNNNSFSVWNTLSGVNSRGLRHHPPIKLNERRANPLQFNMNF
jgi:hypothetical protein